MKKELQTSTQTVAGIGVLQRGFGVPQRGTAVASSSTVVDESRPAQCRLVLSIHVCAMAVAVAVAVAGVGVPRSLGFHMPFYYTELRRWRRWRSQWLHVLASGWSSAAT